MQLKFSAFIGLADMQYIMTNPKNYAKNYLKKIDDKLKVATIEYIEFVVKIVDYCTYYEHIGRVKSTLLT